MTTEDIEDDIARTRDEMADTLNAIERRLSPQQIMDQAVDTMREFLSDRTRVAEMVRDNPIPLALVGLGLGWLAVSAVGASGGRRSRAQAATGSYESMEGVAPAWAGDETGGGYAPGVESPAYGTAGSAEYVAAGSPGQAGTTTRSLRDAAQRTRGKVDQWSRQARASASQVTERTRDAFQDHPLTIGALAMVVGAAVGAMLPRSRTEREAFGETAGNLARQARQAGSELAEKAGRVAERAAQGAKEEGERAFRQETGSPSGMTH